MKRYIIGLDEGTTSARSVVYDIKTKEIISIANAGFKQYYPKLGWVEHDAKEIYKAQISTLNKVLRDSKIKYDEIIGVGITNQRETVVAWNKSTGEPICNAIVWQCRRTGKMMNIIPQEMKEKIRLKTGLIPDAYFSASKMKWIIDNVPESKALIKQKNLCMGTIDAFLAYKLTGAFVTDTTNASRTMLFNIHTMDWDDELLNYFGIPKDVLPRVVGCDEIVGTLHKYGNIQLCGMAGDQQSSMIGQSCLNKGMAKVTYGTGCFVLVNTGNQPHTNLKNILTTVGYTINGKTTYALEGSVFSACNAINWMGDNLKIYRNVADTANMAKSLENNAGVYVVPAFTGLGSPYWDSDARGSIVGMTLDTKREHIVRGVLESIAYNTKAIIDEMALDEVKVKELRVDGGGSKNDFLLQFQADMVRAPIVKGSNSEATVMGAIYLVALATKTYSLDDIKQMYITKQEYNPLMPLGESRELYKGWQKAVERSLNWV